ncbi:hypothetical protein AJ80_04440 [Polytolypa hystricis UAMH7299]|uniref:Nucleolar protein 12 n=1 Tax=Polytolypa hystricis (strain UAMH7299) TaxID=1447883 RepID=A0A2B7YBA6_POLH7|nr:hypothetical protein AJ80_04440 [Polytolypa hystricis UAMH7299]
MAKKEKSQDGKKSKKSADTTAAAAAAPAFLASAVKPAKIDPLLASLFEKSAGPVQVPQHASASRTLGRGGKRSSEEDSEAEPDSDEEDEPMVDVDGDMSVDEEEEEEELAEETLPKDKSRKRKRGNADDALEDIYMQKIAKEEEKEEAQRRKEKKEKRRKLAAEENGAGSDDEQSQGSGSEDEEEDAADSALPVHESLAGTNDTEGSELDKSTRTVFLSNVSTEAIKSKSAKKTLLAHLASFLPSLPTESGKTTAAAAAAHKIESIRFRSTAFASKSVPKRGSFAKRELMDATMRSTNAYVVYSTTMAARRAPTALNGTVVLDRHLRVDSVAHPAPVDNKRCIFVGNLGFVDDESAANDKGEDDEDPKKAKKSKSKPPGDVEEGLWRTFNEHAKSESDPATATATAGTRGAVESVRVVRDPLTRIGKGFAYVQFHDENSVEAALLLNEKKFPPLLPRKLRITRAKRIHTKSNSNNSRFGNANKTVMGDKSSSLQGRAKKLLGRAGAAKLRDSHPGTGANASSSNASPLIFEGHRATAGNNMNLRTKSRGAKGKPKGKPKTRSSKRGTAWKAKDRKL